MRLRPWLVCGLVLVLVTQATLATAAERALWTTSKVIGSPEPPDPYRLELAYPKLKFEDPLSASLIPGSKQLLVAGRHGQIWVVDTSAKEPTSQLVVHLNRTVYGIAAHPQFQKKWIRLRNVARRCREPDSERQSFVPIDRQSRREAGIRH